MTLVSGNIVLPPETPAGVAVRVVVNVRDVTYVGGIAPLRGSTTLTDVDIGPDVLVPFALDVADGDQNVLLSLEAHVDVDGSGLLSAGDLITMEIWPVLNQGAPSELDVAVRLIDG